MGGIAPPVRMTMLGTREGTAKFDEVDAGEDGDYQTFGNFIRLDRRGGVRKGPLSTFSDV